jgi:hypothetical protein
MRTNRILGGSVFQRRCRYERVRQFVDAETAANLVAAGPHGWRKTRHGRAIIITDGAIIPFEWKRYQGDVPAAAGFEDDMIIARGNRERGRATGSDCGAGRPTGP